MKEMLEREGAVFLLQTKLTPGDITVRPAKALLQRPGAFYLE